MSYTEFHTGKLRKIDMGGYQDRGLEHQIPYLEGKGYIFEDVEIINNYFYSENVIKIDDIFYEILDHVSLRDDEFNGIVNDNPDGSISFVLQFYNGGCGFEEALEDVIKNKRKKDEK